MAEFCHFQACRLRFLRSYTPFHNPIGFRKG